MHINDLADLCFKPAFQCLLFFKMDSRQDNRSKLFFFTAKVIARYSSERSLSTCGQKMSEGFLKFCKLQPDTRSDHCVKSFTETCIAAGTTLDFMKQEKDNKTKQRQRSNKITTQAY